MIDNNFLYGFQKVSGVMDVLKGSKRKLGNLFELASAVGKGTAKIEHKLDPEDLKKLLKSMEELKPKIGPMHIIAGSILAGMGAPIGAAMVRSTAQGAKNVFSAPASPGNPTYQRPRVQRPFA